MKQLFIILSIVVFSNVAMPLIAQETIMISDNIMLTKYCDEYIVDYWPASISYDTIISCGEFFYRAKFADMSHVEYTENAGYPELPIYSISLQFPIDECEITVETDPLSICGYQNTYSYIPIPDGLYYYPTQDLPDDQDCPLNMNDDFYFYYDTISWMTQDYYYDTIPVPYMVFGNVTFNILPLHYNPETNSLRQLPPTRFIITPSCSNLCIEESQTLYDPVWGQDAVNFFDNYEGDEYDIEEVGTLVETYHSGNYSFTTTYKGRYLIIVQDAYESEISDFVDHKMHYGYDVEVLTVTQAITEGTTYATNYNINVSSLSTAEKIRYAIKDKKECYQDLKYVLLVSEQGVIPSSDSNINSDIFYAALSNHLLPNLFLLPEVYIGRWIFSDVNSLRNIIYKTITTETQSRNYYATLAIGNGIGYDEFKKANTKVSKILADNNISCNSIIDYTNYANTLFFNSLYYNDNIMWLYRGHANNTIIGFPYFLSATDYIFANSFVPFGFSFSCSNNPYLDNGFGSLMLTNTSMYGDATFYGASANSIIGSNSKLEKSVFKVLKRSQTIGQLVTSGSRKYYDACRTSTLKQKQVKLYNLFGDPSLYWHGLNRTTGEPRTAPMLIRNSTREFDYNSNVEMLENRYDELEEISVYNVMGLYLGTFSIKQIINFQDGNYILILNTEDGVRVEKAYIKH